MADYLGKNVKSGKILVVIGVPGQGFSEDITAGLKAGLKKYPGLQIADSSRVSSPPARRRRPSRTC